MQLPQVLLVGWPTPIWTSHHTNKLCAPTFHISQCTMWKSFLKWDLMKMILSRSSLAPSGCLPWWSQHKGMSLCSACLHPSLSELQGGTKSAFHARFPSMIDFFINLFEKTVDCSWVTLPIPTVLIASLPGRAFTIHSFIPYGYSIPCTRAIALKAFLCCK